MIQRHWLSLLIVSCLGNPWNAFCLAQEPPQAAPDKAANKAADKVANKAADVPKLRAELVAPVVYAGETPRVRLTITAPRGRAMKVIRPEAAWETGALDLYLARFGEGRGSTGRPDDGEREATAEDYLELAAGQSFAFEEPLHMHPKTGGAYQVEVQVAIDPDKAVTFTERLRFTAVEIPASAILHQSVVPIRPNPTIKADQQELQLLVVKSDKDCTLIYRVVNLASGVETVCRLFPVTADAKTIATYKAPDDKQIEWPGQLWFTCNHDGKLLFVRLGRISGEILEKKTLGE
jgi:hypothetical protein